MARASGGQRRGAARGHGDGPAAVVRSTAGRPSSAPSAPKAATTVSVVRGVGFDEQFPRRTVEEHWPALEPRDLDLAAANGPGDESQASAVWPRQRDVDGVRMIRPIERPRLEPDVEAACRGVRQRREERRIGERLAHEPHREGPIRALHVVGAGVRAVGVERQHGGPGHGTKQRARHAAEVEAARRVGTGRPAHHGAEVHG